MLLTMMKLSLPLPLLSSLVLSSAASSSAAAGRALPPRSDELLGLDDPSSSPYTFDRYVVDFDKPYRPDTAEWDKRERIFLANLALILEHNALYYAEDGDGDDAGSSNNNERRRRPTHTLGINHLADLEPSELQFGYDKGGHRSFRSSSSSSSGVLSGAAASGDGNDDNEDDRTTTAVSRRLQGDGGGGGGGDDKRMDLPFAMDDVSNLPYHVDWRKEGVVTAVKDQGMCGSCWAFASTAVLESHVAIKTGTLFDLSPQELVSCVPNPHKCGGAGGCAGATAELAFDFVAGDGHGMVQEYQMGYSSYYGGDGQCKIMGGGEDDDGVPALRGTQGAGRDADANKKIKGAVATIDGYSVCPTNDYKCLMNAVAKVGPVVVAVAASTWGLYEGGVFTSDLSKGGTATDLNHAVVLVGYGVDEQTGVPYWLVRNSWKPTWGEGGYIRLERVDPATLDDPDKDCGVDSTPADGMACETDDDDKKLPTKPVKICGTSGVLFDAVMPVGGRRLH